MNITNTKIVEKLNYDLNFKNNLGIISNDDLTCWEILKHVKDIIVSEMKIKYLYILS